MKSLFGNKKNSNYHGGTGVQPTTTIIEPSDNDVEQQQQQQQQQQHMNRSKTKSLIETLRSADTTLSATPSSTTATSNFTASSATTTVSQQPPQRTNQQQMNKKLFGTRQYGITNHPRNNIDPTHTHTVGYTTSIDPTYDQHLTTTSMSFSTANVSLMVPPSQQQRRHKNHHPNKKNSTTSRKLPPETISSTSQHQYRPPTEIPIVVDTKNNNHHISSSENHTTNSTSLTYPRRSVYSAEHNLNHNMEEEKEHNGSSHDQLHDVALHDDDIDYHDGIDQEHYHRLLSVTNQNMNHINNNNNEETSLKSIDNQDIEDDNDDDDDIVPFAACCTQPQQQPQRSSQIMNTLHSNNNNDASMTTVRFQNNNNNNNTNNNSNEIDTKIPNQHTATCYVKFQYYFVRTGLIYILIVVFTAVSMLYGLSDQLSYMNRHRKWHHKNKEITNLQVAFIGNAYFFVNDIPRLLESISQGYIYQNSCLHAGGSLSDLWVTGNGMYKLWQTDEAIIEYAVTSSSSTTANDDNSNDDDAVMDDVIATNDDDDGMSMATTYDYGFCSVLQLLQGYDKYMNYGNTYGKYYSDGLNPCIVDYNYDNFIFQQLQNDPISTSSSNNNNNNNYWDYIIIVEQTKRMAFPEARNETINFLMNRYGPLIQTSGAIPVLVDTHAFWSSKSNMTGLTDIPTFAALIAQGVTDFTNALSSVLPSYQAPLVAPIGLAYLTIWEEDYTFWQKLFLDDGIHSSVYGSYLFACVLFATLFDQLPTHNNDVSGNSNEYYNIASLFTDARKIVGQASYPTYEEAEYLRNVAGRVTLRGYVPPSLLEALSTLQQKEQSTNTYNNNR